MEKVIRNGQTPVIGAGMNKSELTEEQCLGILINQHITFESMNNDDLDSLYKVATKNWACHLTRQGYIDRLYKFRLEKQLMKGTR
jgi:hypothetical protein